MPSGENRTTRGGFSQVRLARMNEVMSGYVERGELPGFVMLVSRRGEVHVETFGTSSTESSEPMRRDTIFRIASMSKPVTAVAAMILVEECRLRLDDPIDRWLPELADRKVLKRIDGPVDETVPANRAITLRDLLTFRLGYGMLMLPSDLPIQRAISEQGFAPGPPHPSTEPPPDEWMRRLGTLPLIHQPGAQWLYNTGADVLSVLISRVADQDLETFFQERIFAPLGMKDTSFSVPANKRDRFATSYLTEPGTGALIPYDGTGDESQWAHPPVFPSGAGGLVSTVDDFLAFAQMLLGKGAHGGERLLSRPSVELMTSDQLTPAQKAASGFGAEGEDDFGWGFGMSVVTRRDQIAGSIGTFGWDGALGTSWKTDPREDLTGILLTQAAWESPAPPRVCRDFWTMTYQAIDD